MALTLGELKVLVGNRIRDPSFGNIDEDYITAEINATIRKIAKKFDLCQATVTFSVENATASGVITSNTTAFVFGITYYDMSGWPTFIIGNGVRLLSAARHVSEADGTRTELMPAGPAMLDNKWLKDTGHTKFSHYRVIPANDLRLQFYPMVNAGSYPHSFEISFVWVPGALSADEDEVKIPESHQDLIVPSVTAVIENALGRPERVAVNVEESKQESADAREDSTRRARSKVQMIEKTHRRVC